jgi:hypothetical protein
MTVRQVIRALLESHKDLDQPCQVQRNWRDSENVVITSAVTTVVWVRPLHGEIVVEEYNGWKHVHT